MFLRGEGTRTRFVLITGGARSGKSRFALKLAQGNGFTRRLFLATAVECDEEMSRRIARHRKERDGRWATLEEPERLPERLPAKFLRPGGVVLFDCLPTFITNHLLSGCTHTRILRRVQSLLKALSRPGLTTLVVTNEVGQGVVPESVLGRQFQDLLGQANQKAAAAADEVYLLVAGLPVQIKRRSDD